MCIFSYTCTGELRMEKRQLPSSSQSSPSGSTLGHCWDRHWSHHHCCCDYYLSYCHSAGYCLMRVTSRHIHTCTCTQEHLCSMYSPPKCTLKCIIMVFPILHFPLKADINFCKNYRTLHLGIVVVFMPCMYLQVVEPI